MMQINLSAVPGHRNGGVANFSLLSEEGWLRDQEKAAKHP
jgi:hypothetical protein